MSRHLAVECAECGHLHFTPHGYVLCPIAGCSCPYAAGEWPDEAPRPARPATRRAAEMRSRYRGPDAGILYALAVMIPLWLLAALTYWCVSR